MADDYTIPMSGQPQQINQQSPGQVSDQRIPMGVEPFKAIDPMENEKKATALEMQQSQLKEQQSQQKMQEQEQEDMTKDRTKLQAYNDSGGNLHTVEGIDAALKEGGWSQKTIAGLIARKEAIQKNSIEFQKALHEEDTNKITEMHRVMQDTLKRASVPSDKYEQALSDGKDPTAAAKIFNDEIQALITEERTELDPATGKPRMGEEKLAAMAKMSPQDWKEKIKEGDYKVKQVKLNLDTRKTEADIKEKENKAKKEAAEEERIKKSGPIGATGASGASSEDPASTGLTGDAYLKTLPAGRAATAKAIGEGRETMADASRGTKDRKQLLEDVNRAYPEYNAIAVKANSAALTQNTKQLTAIRPYKEMIDKQIEVVTELGQKVISSDSKLANHTLNWIKQNTGDNPDTAEYLAQVHFTATEAARLLNTANLTGVLSVEAKRDMDKIVSGDMPINSINRVFSRAQKDGDFRVDALEKEHGRLTKGNKKEVVTPVAGGEKSDGYTNTPKGETSGDTKEILQKELVKAQEQVATAKTPEEKHRAEIDVEDLQRDLKRKNISVAPKAAAPKLSGQHAEAVSWAKANPNDPRSKQILSLNGM